MDNKCRVTKKNTNGSLTLKCGTASKQAPPRKSQPTRDNVSVGAWQERDRIGIWITDNRTDKTVAEWWDEGAQEMFEDGFFKPGDTRGQGIKGAAFENSVLDYAEDIGFLRKKK